ncbi:hypothetical protein H4217_005716 [Coemansia sp. RSA 1939]|nr:hypothetical protein H4217_005716 [Coemansia sp. RSA 1939]
MPASVAHQSFWDRVPNASMMRTQLLGKRGRGGDGNGHGHGARYKLKTHPCALPRGLTHQQLRVNKRKQLHPMRSPQTATSVGTSKSAAGSDSSSRKPPTARTRCMSLDGRLSQSPLLRGADTAGRNGSISTHGHTRRAENDGVGGSVSLEGVPSRAFRLSFSDDYLRNPHEYVQALIDSEASGAASVHKSHASSGHGRTRRSTNGGSGRSRPSAAHGRRNRSGRFHNLQLEQSVFSTQLDNDDANSVTTTASDINDLADIDGQVPGTPTNYRRSKAGAETDEDGDDLRTQSGRSGLVASAKGGVADDVDDMYAADRDDTNGSQTNSQANSQPDTPAPAALEQAADGQNMPSYERLGQDFASGSNDDLALIAPPFALSTVKWTKADPIDVAEKPMADKLAAAEQHCCSVLRIMPEQYLSIKHTLLKESRSRPPGSFKKRDAQRLCRIDVNKTSKIYEWYVSMGWLSASNGIYALPPEDI